MCRSILLTVLLLAISIGAFAQVGGPPAANEHVHQHTSRKVSYAIGDGLPYNAIWGQYQLSLSLSDQDEMILRLTDSAGRVAIKLHGRVIYALENGDMLGEPNVLHVSASDGSNLICHHRDYFISQSHGVLVTLSAIGGLSIDGQHRSQTLNGRPVLIDETAAPVEFVGDIPICHAAVPEIAIVLAWNGHGYQVDNIQFPTEARFKARNYQRRIIADHHDISSAIGFYVSSAQLGHARFAKRWLMTHLAHDERAEFFDDLWRLDMQVRRIPMLFDTKQSNDINAETGYEYFDDTKLPSAHQSQKGAECN